MQTIRPVSMNFHIARQTDPSGETGGDGMPIAAHGRTGPVDFASRFHARCHGTLKVVIAHGSMDGNPRPQLDADFAALNLTDEEQTVPCSAFPNEGLGTSPEVNRSPASGKTPGF